MRGFEQGHGVVCVSVLKATWAPGAARSGRRARRGSPGGSQGAVTAASPDIRRSGPGRLTCSLPSPRCLACPVCRAGGWSTPGTPHTGAAL